MEPPKPSRFIPNLTMTSLNSNAPRLKDLSYSSTNNDVSSEIRSNTGAKPYVLYSESTDNPEPKLTPVDAPIPDNARFASPIYYLREKEIQRQDRLDTGYEVSDTHVAKEIQDTVEKEEREYYPIYVESDAPVKLDTQVEWIREFCQEKLNINPNDCNWYYSGGGSIHLHTPKLATKRDLPKLRDLVEEYEYELDSQIYTRKRQFRLPGAIHEDNQLPKVQIDPEWSHKRIIRESTTTEVSTPDTFGEVLTHTFGENVLERPQAYLWNPESDSFNAGLNKWEYFSNTGGAIHAKWKAHYSHPVSPYANAGNGNRSLLVAKPIDGAFAEERESHYEGENENISDTQIKTIVPCQILAFWGCQREYQVDRREYRPVQLSKTDYQKFVNAEIEEGDIFVLIGGQSRKSRLYKPRMIESKTIAGATEFIGAIETLETFGYDTGESGLNPTNIERTYTDTKTKENTRAYELQLKAEKNGIDTLSHGDIILVVNRLLKIKGIDETREWFKKEYGSNYDESLTNQQIKSVCEKYNDLPDYRGSNVTRREI